MSCAWLPRCGSGDAIRSEYACVAGSGSKHPGRQTRCDAFRTLPRAPSFASESPLPGERPHRRYRLRYHERHTVRRSAVAGLRARPTGTWRFGRDSARRGEFVRPAAADRADTSAGRVARESAGSSRPPWVICGRDPALLLDETGRLAVHPANSSILSRDPPRPGRANAPAATPDPAPRRPRYGGAPRQVPRTGGALVSRLRGDARRPRKYLTSLLPRARAVDRVTGAGLQTGASRGLPRS